MQKKQGISSVWIIHAVLLIIVTIVGGLYWGRSVTSPQKPEPAYSPGAENTIVVFLGFPTGEELKLETREIPERRGRLSLGEDIVRELLRGPKGELERIVPPEAELKAFYIDTDGVAYIDLDRQSLGLPKDAFEEYLAIQSFFQSLRKNIPGINAVKFLIDSKEVDTLWGHIDAATVWKQEYEKL